MLAPMCLGRPSKSFYFAMITTIGSVIGGVFGYVIGMFSFELIEPIIEMFKYSEKLEHVKVWFADWGFWAILIAGFSPIPYKLFTIAAGMLSMVFIPFVLASVVGRGARFFLVAFLVSLGGDTLKNKLKDYIEIIGWAVTVIIVVGLLLYKFY